MTKGLLKLSVSYLILTLLSINTVFGESSKQQNELASKLIEKALYIDAYKHANLARQIAIQENDMQNLAESLKLIGTSFYYSSDYTSALDFYTQSLLIYEHHKDVNKQIILLSNIANVYSELGDYKNALNLNEKAITLSLNQNADESYSWLYLNYAYDLGQSGYYKFSLQEYERILKEDDLSNEIKIYALLQKSQIHLINQDFDSAISEASEAKKLALDQESEVQLLNADLLLSTIALKKDKTKFNDEQLKKVENHPLMKNQPVKLLEIYQLLMSYYNQKNSFHEAFTYAQKYIQTEKEIKDLKARQYKEIHAIEMNLRDNKQTIQKLKQDHIEDVRSLKSQYNKLIFALTAIVALLLSIILIIYFKNKKKR